MSYFFEAVFKLWARYISKYINILIFDSLRYGLWMNNSLSGLTAAAVMAVRTLEFMWILSSCSSVISSCE